ncbi:BH3-interacting domain death agonist isoform X4 [Molossus molossus]|uniref:BH3-interacting domain death agonist isoform X4 n=1 Tax=Molossus molossus TaxID=27622 RepID=UPI001747B761|nr:BH3-interacting domain death agonist isoform X4 [Molossus molossus]
MNRSLPATEEGHVHSGQCRECWERVVSLEKGCLQAAWDICEPDPVGPQLLCHGSQDSESQEEAIRSIARQLALIGDRMDHSIPPTLVQQLVVQFMNRNLSEEDRREHLAAALQQVMQTYPRDVEEEKIMLTLTMLLAKKVADHTPSLLRDVFRTTVNFINQNLLTCVRNLVRNEVD